MAVRKEEAKLVRLAGAAVLVDGFQFLREDVNLHVLTHFHSDHTVGLTRSFSAGTIFCTQVTAALITQLIGVDPARVRGLALDETVALPGAGGVRMTLLDADHCPGSAVAVFEAPTLAAGADDGRGGGSAQRLVLHTGDCRASESMREGLRRWLAGRQVGELFLDTTYCDRRWNFPPQSVACEWLQDLTRTELAREPRTLFVVGSYQIGKERAVRAVAEVVDSPAHVEARRWRVLQLAHWGDARLPSGKSLWSRREEDCQVWMSTMASLSHEALEGILASVNGRFDAVVAFRPTGWSWAPKRMSAEGSSACKPWVGKSGRTRIYSVPYSEHSSYTELRALAEMLMPRRLIPTVNSETSVGKERVMRNLIGTFDLRADPERMDHYLGRADGVDEADMVDVLALSAKRGRALPRGGGTAHGVKHLHSEVVPCGWSSGVLRSRASGQPVDLDLTPPAPPLEPPRNSADTLPGRDGHSADFAFVDADADVVEVPDSDSDDVQQFPPAKQPLGQDDLQCVNLAQQQRLLQFYETDSRNSRAKVAFQTSKLKRKRGKKAKAGSKAVDSGRTSVLQLRFKSDPPKNVSSEQAPPRAGKPPRPRLPPRVLDARRGARGARAGRLAQGASET
mmetsp:Transcript_98133/g.263756  ORF Transcript_98133/g.263756 Transcript_98133/m.263756 type:complete len:623 (+) Transcript_98133:169-2037(+)